MAVGVETLLNSPFMTIMVVLPAYDKLAVLYRQLNSQYTCSVCDDICFSKLQPQDKIKNKKTQKYMFFTKNTFFLYNMKKPCFFDNPVTM